MFAHAGNGCGRSFGVRHLNYNHLHYFWVVVTSGSIAKAAASLHVTPQTISGQLRALEGRLGSSLFKRVGRKLELSQTGKMVHSYAHPMFSLGGELGAVLERGAPQRASQLCMGVVTGVGKLIAGRILGAALDVAASTRVLCREVSRDTVAAALLARDIDFAVTDFGIPSLHAARIHSYPIGHCGGTFLCSTTVAERYRSRFPASLDGAPLVLPAPTSSFARSLRHWLRLEKIVPEVVAEIDSPDLASAVAEIHGALFALPTTIACDVAAKQGVAAVGAIPSIEQHFYIACPELGRHDGIASIVESAREQFRAATEEARWAFEPLRARERFDLCAPASSPLREECAI